MISAALTTAQRFAPPPESFMTGRWFFPRLTWADADALVRIGIIPEDATTELLDGLIVLKDR
ncbi:MAG: hypothetical protein JWO31_3290, partial [Phycisphaerales bacterium]|nr:hypothetical protein [Phycisphaerales bacterium]